MKKLIYDSDLPESLISNVGGNLVNLVDGKLKKEASSSSITKEMLDSCKPDKDHFLVHLIALGDFETYGANRNQDAFSKEACIKYHNTFVENGMLYREHRHDSKDKAIGLVKASAYNEEMGRIELAVWGNKKTASEEWDLAKDGKPLSFSMSCFPGRTPVMLGDGRFEVIENLKPGATVISKDGNVCNVKALLVRTYTGEMYNISVCGFENNFSATKEHPIWVRTLGGEEKYVPACDVNHNHYLRIPILRDVDNTYIRPSLSSLIGYVMSRGYLLGKKEDHVEDSGVVCIKLNLNRRDVSEAPKILEHLSTLGFKDGIEVKSTKVKNRSVIISIYNKDAIALLSEYLDFTKAYPQPNPKILKWNHKAQLNLLESYLSIKGHKSDYTKLIHVFTQNIYIRSFLLQILLRNNIKPLLVENESGYPEFKVSVDHFPELKSQFDRRFNVFKAFSDNSYFDDSKIHEDELLFIDGDFFYCKVNNVEVNNVENKTVYDIVVENDHSFVVSCGFGVSNCHVPYDRCSCCGFEAKNDHDRCEHIKYARGQYIQPFKKYAFMWNDHPKFFDISRVARPADRIAHHIFIDVNLQKAASASGLEIRSSDYRRVGNVYIPDSEIKGCTDITKNSILRKLASLSEKVNYVINNNITSGDEDVIIINNFVKQARYSDLSLSDDELNKLQPLRPDTFFYELVKRGCVLPFADFVSYCLSQPVSVTKNSVVYKYAMIKEIPVVFQDMITEDADPNLEDAFDMGSRSLSEMDPANTDEIQSIMDKAKNLFSVEPHAVKKRIVNLNKKASFERSVIDTATDDEIRTAKRLSKAYGYYKLSAAKELIKNSNVNNNILDFILLC